MATTRDYTDYLNDQVDIAPVNSQEELQASEIVESLFVQHGLETHVEEFDAPILASLSSRIYLIVLFLGMLLSGFIGTPVSVIGLVLVAVSFVLIALARNDNDVLAAIGPQARSQNVVGVHRATGPNVIKGNRPIVIVAHYDTPRENFLYNKQFAKWQPIIKRLAWPLSIAVLVLTLMQVMPFLPVIARRVFWVLGVLAALPLLLLGASSVYERFAPCTTGANDNKASMAALLGVLDMVRPGPDDAKRWAATHPKSVRRSLEEELEDEIYGDEWDDEEYADEGAFVGDEEGYAEEEQYPYEEAAEDEGYADENLGVEDAFEDEESYTGEAYADQDELPEDGYEDFVDEEPLEESETDEEYLDDEYFEDEAAEEDYVSAQRVYTPAAAAAGLVDEYGLETPTTVRRGASVLESLQVLPETCEIVYENLIPRDEAIDRIEGVAEQVDEVYEEEAPSEALARAKSVAGGVGKAIIGALFAARDWAQRVFDRIGELFVSIKERFGKDHNLPEIDKAGEAAPTTTTYDEYEEDYSEDYLDETAGAEDEVLDSGVDEGYLDNESDEDYLEGGTDEEYLEDETDEDYFDADEYLDEEELYDEEFVDEGADEVEESEIEPLSMPSFSSLYEEAVEDDFIPTETPGDAVDDYIPMRNPSDAVDNFPEVESYEAEEPIDDTPVVEELAGESLEEETVEEDVQQESDTFGVYVPEDKYHIDGDSEVMDVPLADFELIDEEESIDIPELEDEYADDFGISSESTGQLPRVNVVVREEIEEEEEIDAIADAEAAVASLWVPSEPPAEIEPESVEVEFDQLDEPADAEAPDVSELESVEAASAFETSPAFEVPAVVPVDVVPKGDLVEAMPETPVVEEAPALTYDILESSLADVSLDEPEGVEPPLEQPDNVTVDTSYIYDEEPFAVSAPEVADESVVRSASYEEIGDTQANEVIDADPWGPYLDVMDAEFELLEDDADEVDAGGVPVEVVDVPSMGLGYEIPGLTPTDELFDHEQVDTTSASDWNTASVSAPEVYEHEVADEAYQGLIGLEQQAADTYAPTEEAEPVNLWAPASGEALDESAVDEIFDSVIESVAEQNDEANATSADEVPAVSAAVVVEEDASSILHAMFTTAPEREYIEPPQTSDVLHEMFATRPNIEPEQPAVTEDLIELDEPDEEWNQVAKRQTSIDEAPLPAIEVQEEIASEVVEEPESETIVETIAEPEPIVADEPTMEESVAVEPEEADELVEVGQYEDLFEQEQETQAETVETQPEVDAAPEAVAELEDAFDSEVLEEIEVPTPELDVVTDFAPETEFVETFEQPSEMLDEPEAGVADQPVETVDFEDAPIDDFVAEASEDDTVPAEETMPEAEAVPEVEMTAPAEPEESVDEPEESFVEEAAEEFVEEEPEPLTVDVPELAEDVAPYVESVPEAAEDSMQEAMEPVDDLLEPIDEPEDLTATSEPEVEEASEQTDPYSTQLMPGLMFSTEEDVSEEELADKDVTGLTMFSEEVEADIEDSLPVSDDRIPKPRAVDDPNWGKTNFKPSTVTVGRRAMLLDLPDPSVMSVDPLDVGQSGIIAQGTNGASRAQVNATAARSAEAQRRLDALRRVPSPLDEPINAKPEPAPEPEPEPEVKPQQARPAAAEPELPKYNKSKNIGSRTPKKNAKRKIRFGHRRKNEPEQVESMGEWLGLDDDYDAKKDGRQIGSWDNFDDDGSRGKWKGGATYRAGLRDEYDDDVLPSDQDFDRYDREPEYAGEDGQMIDDVERGALDDEAMTELREAVLRLGDDDLISHDIWFVGLGSSTLDHAGMRAFLDEHRRDIRGAFLVNIDSVGAGDLKVLTSEGMGNKRRADRRMVRMFTNIADALHIDLGRADYSWEETDATPAMQRSVRVNTLMGVSADGVAAHSHTPNDEPEYLDDRQIANVADLIAELIRRS